MNEFTIALEPADQPEVRQLIEELDAYQMPLAPLESHHGIDIVELLRPNVVFVVARDAAGAAVGCGAMVLGAGFGELKRMYVRPDHRGSGVAQELLTWLEEEAKRCGCSAFLLETGVQQQAAQAFYKRAGYSRRGPFGDYSDDPHSVFMQKILL